MDLWLLVFLLVVVQPLLGWWRFRRFVGRAPVVTTDRKLRLYVMVVATQWILTGLCAWVMRRRELDIADLGLLRLGPPWAWLVAFALAAVLAGATVMAVRSIRRGQADVPSHLRHVARILPTRPLERAGFVPVAITAGICEETLYRGFLTFALFQVFHSMPVALGLGTLAFGFGHLYQGPRGILSTAVLGAFLASLYWGAASLWPGIVLHAIVDLANGNALGSLAAPSSAQPAVGLAPPAPPDHTDGEAGVEPAPEETTGT